MKIENLISSALKAKDTKKYIKIGNAYEWGDHGVESTRKEAILWYKKAASSGDVQGLLCLARLYEDEWNSKRSQRLAHKYYLEAANKGNPEAQHEMGISCYFGYGTDVSITDAIQWFEKASKSQYHQSWFQLAYTFLDKSCEVYNSERGDYWVKRILKENNPDYFYELAHAYLDGERIEQSTKLAVKFFKNASELGCIDAKLRLAEIYATGEGVRKNIDLLNTYLEEIYASNNARRISRVAGDLEYDENLRQSGARAFNWYKKAAQLGDAYAQMKVGRLYRDGKDCRKSYKLAESWLMKAAEQGNGSAAYSLGALYKKDWENQDYQKAMQYFKLALKQGVTSSYSKIGWMYQLGTGVKKSNSIAIRWFNKGVEHSDRSSHYALGYVNLHGYGCPQDYKLAFYHYKTGVEQGHSYACTGLGYLYQQGLGCRKNVKRAAELYQQGASDNIADCCSNLAVMYDNGLYFDVDSTKAVELFKQAADLGSDYAKYWLGIKYLYGEGLKKNTHRADSLFQETIQNDSVHFPAFQYHHFAEKHLDNKNILDNKQALLWFEKAANMGYAKSHLSLGCLYLGDEIVKQDVNKAISYFQKAIKAGCFEAYGNLGYLYWKGELVKRDHKRSKELYHRAYETNELVDKNNYSWLLSTSPNKNVINGILAIDLANQAIKQFGRKSCRIDTLASAYAANDNFEEAVRKQKQAIRLLKKEGKLDQVEDFERRLAYYERKKRWIEE